MRKEQQCCVNGDLHRFLDLIRVAQHFAPVSTIKQADSVAQLFVDKTVRRAGYSRRRIGHRCSCSRFGTSTVEKEKLMRNARIAWIITAVDRNIYVRKESKLSLKLGNSLGICAEATAIIKRQTRATAFIVLVVVRTEDIEMFWNCILLKGFRRGSLNRDSMRNFK